MESQKGWRDLWSPLDLINMVDIPEHLLIKTAEARAKALGISVEQALAEMKGEAEPTTISKEPEVIDVKPIEVKEAPAPAAQVKEAPAPAAAVKTDVPAKVDFAPETRVTQRLLTVVKAKPIQKPTSEPVDKVNTWPHLMLPEFISLMAMTAFLIFISAILQAPLLEEANPNITPNPAKAPWYFLGLQELLSYWDPQIAGVMIPLIIGVVAFCAIPYIDRNKSNKPSNRKYAIMLWTFFLAGAGTLSLIGILFRGPGWNWTYPWIDGVWFDDLLDWVHFE